MNSVKKMQVKEKSECNISLNGGESLRSRLTGKSNPVPAPLIVLLFDKHAEERSLPVPELQLCQSCFRQ